ncbi:MAG: hypothetical protein JF621_00440 [Streptomyces turgidiscabies]|nr:hypothetical protein [Streptomyces turgidiscabies]
MVDTSSEGRVGEFRGVAGPYWSLRPVCGGTEWDAAPAHVRPATPAERLSARTARENARSRGGSRVTDSRTAQTAVCHDCQELDRAEAAARVERDASRVTDCRVLRARHQVAEHGERS